MKFLKIEDGKAKFLKNAKTTEYASIMEMISQDIYNILILIAQSENVEFDREVSTILNDAEKIVYTELLKKFDEFDKEKESLKVEINSKFKELEEKYLSDPKTK